MPTRRARPRGVSIEDVLTHALTKPGAWLDHPWSEEHQVVKVHDKMFVVVGADQQAPCFSIKHEDLESRDIWRSRYADALGPTPYMANKPWSRVFVEAGVDADDVRELVDESYLAVVGRLPKKHRPQGWDADLG